MREVLGRIGPVVANNMRRIGIPTERARARIPFSDEELLRPTFRVDWGYVCDFLETLQEDCGGPDGLADAMDRCQPRVFSDFLPLVRFVISPRELYRLLHVMMPMVYACVSFDERDAPDGRLIVTATIADGCRPCAAYLHACRGGMRAVPRILGLPPAEVAFDIAPRRGVFTIALPESQTALARMRRADPAAVVRVAVAELLDSWSDLRARLDEVEDAQARLARLASELEREVEQRRRAEAALGAAIAGPERAFAERLEAHARAWGLTPRQIEVLALLARGASNKEIADRLDCAAHTAELHVTAVLQRSRSRSRAALVAAFWGDATDGSEPAMRG